MHVCVCVSFQCQCRHHHFLCTRLNSCPKRSVCKCVVARGRALSQETASRQLYLCPICRGVADPFLMCVGSQLLRRLTLLRRASTRSNTAACYTADQLLPRPKSVNEGEHRCVPPPPPNGLRHMAPVLHDTHSPSLAPFLHSQLTRVGSGGERGECQIISGIPQPQMVGGRSSRWCILPDVRLVSPCPVLCTRGVFVTRYVTRYKALCQLSLATMKAVVRLSGKCLPA